MAHSPGCGPQSRQGALQLQQKGRKVSAAGLKTDSEAWAGQRQPMRGPAAPLCAGPHAGGRHCGASQSSSAAGSRLVCPSHLTTGLLSASTTPFFLPFPSAASSLGPSASSALPRLFLYFFLPFLPLCVSQSSGYRRD